MVKDAELHASEDKARRATVEAKNQGEALVHATEKSLSEFGDKVDADTKSSIESALNDLKESLKGDNAEDIKAKTNALAQSSMKLGEAMYAAKSADNNAGAGDADAKKDDVVDAEFTEVKDDKDNKKSA
jgi:molecular chaperone DnaK